MNSLEDGQVLAPVMNVNSTTKRCEEGKDVQLKIVTEFQIKKRVYFIYTFILQQIIYIDTLDLHFLHTAFISFDP